MYKQKQLEEDARTVARDVVYQISQRTANSETYSEIAAVMEDELVTHIRHAIRDAYFKGLRDASWEYEARSGFREFKKAIEQAYNDLV